MSYQPPERTKCLSLAGPSQWVLEFLSFQTVAEPAGDQMLLFFLPSSLGAGPDFL